MAWFNFVPQNFAYSFLSVLFESVPFLLLGALLSGLIEVFVPARWMTRLLPRNPLPAVLISGFLGVIFPMCECGVVPVIRRLMKKGLPVSCAVTYLLASPVVNPIVVVSTFAAFRGQHPALVTGFRLVLSYAVAIIVGLIVTRLRPEQFINDKVLETLPGRARRTSGFRIGGGGSFAASAVARFTQEGTEAGSGNVATLAALDNLEADLQPTFARRLLAALQRGANDFLDVAVFVVIGAALASVFNTAVDQQRIITPLATNPLSATVALMALAFVVAVCSTSDAFIAATLIKFSIAARLAFLVFGPIFDLKLVFLYSLVFKRRFVFALGVGLFVLVALICTRLSVVIF